MSVPMTSFRFGFFARTLVGTALLVLSGCTTTGQGKNTQPALKVFKTEHPYRVPPDPIRCGDLELRVTKVFLEENATIFETSNWIARMRAVIVSSDALPISALSDSFTMIGKSGQVYRAHVSTVGPGRKTWQHQEHTGQPTHLPAGVAGELEIFTQVGDDKTHDELVAFTFQGVHVPLAR